MESTITARGQLTLPNAIRDELGLKPGDRVKFFLHPDGSSVVLLPKLPITVLRGMLKSRKRRPVTIEEMREAVAAGASERGGTSPQTAIIEPDSSVPLGESEARRAKLTRPRQR